MGETGLNDELRAMQDIAVALHRLDPPTRGRVLRWIIERFQADLPFNSVLPASTAATVEPDSTVSRNQTDETLAIGSLTDLFPQSPLAIKTAAPQSITGMLQDLVAEFQDLAREWNGPQPHRADEPSADSLPSVAS